jgi:hypothetical protein
MSGNLQLLKDPLAREQDGLALMMEANLFRSARGFRRFGIGRGFGLLLLDGLTLPSPGHKRIIRLLLPGIEHQEK